MNAPIGLDEVLDLQAAINKYCELSPDPYARAHYQNALESVPVDGVANVERGWQWLRDRIRQDTTVELVSIGDCQHGQWWEDWDFVPFGIDG